MTTFGTLRPDGTLTKPGENAEHDQPCTNPGHAGQTYAQCGHTPGPWKVSNARFLPGPFTWIIENESANKVTAGTSSEADARLIAAAPEMYRLIKLSFLAGRFPEIGEGVEQWNPAEVARALLARIEGK